MSEMSETVRRFYMPLPSGLNTDEVADEMERLEARNEALKKCLEDSLTVPQQQNQRLRNRVAELESLLVFAGQRLWHDVACPDECLKCECAKEVSDGTV